MEICYHGNWNPSGLWVNHRESCLGRLRGRRLSAAENAGLGAKLQVGHWGHYVIFEPHTPAEPFRDKTCKHKVVGFLFIHASHRDNCVNVFGRQIVTLAPDYSQEGSSIYIQPVKYPTPLPPVPKMRCHHSLQPHTFSSQYKHRFQSNTFSVFMTCLLLSNPTPSTTPRCWSLNTISAGSIFISRKYFRHSLCTMPELINTVISGWTTAWEYECVFMLVCFKDILRCLS